MADTWGYVISQLSVAGMGGNIVEDGFGDSELGFMDTMILHDQHWIVSVSSHNLQRFILVEKCLLLEKKHINIHSTPL